MTYLIHIFFQVGLFSLLAISLNLLTGYIGLVSIVQAGFFGIGAYSTALLSTNCEVSFWLSLPIGIIVTIFLSLLIGIISLRFRDDYFVITTFGLQIIIYGLMQNWIELTRGPSGISGIRSPSLFGVGIVKGLSYLFIILFALLFATKLIIIITRSPFGRVLKSIREDETYTISLGKPIYKFKILAFVLCSIFASIGGSIYASYTSYVDPSTFTVNQSIFILSIVIIGGMESIGGSILSATLLLVFPETLKFIGLPISIASNFRHILYGALLILFLIWKPMGLKGESSWEIIKSTK